MANSDPVVQFQEFLKPDHHCALTIEDLDATMKQTIINMEKQRRAQRRAEMVEYRKTKKKERRQSQSEHVRLERELFQLVESVRAAARTCPLESQTVEKSLRELVADQETLRRENLALRDVVEQHEKLRQLVLTSSHELESIVPFPYAANAGWRVQFDGNVPSFHFHPFTRDEFDAGMNKFELELAKSASSLLPIGIFLGWNVYHAPLVSNSNSILARVQLTKRVRCPLDLLLRVSYMKEKELSPTIITPIGFSIHQSQQPETQLLQELDHGSLVFAHNVPGPGKNLRYLYFGQRSQWQLPDGRRKLILSTVIADSEANHRSREAEGLQENVEWATEGGMKVSGTEVDGAFIDVVCERWTNCSNKLHADHMMAQWAQHASWWEQTVTPTSLLLQL